MLNSPATTSPFVAPAIADEWIIWQQKSTLFDLLDNKEMNCQPENKFEEATKLPFRAESAMISAPVRIERRQYNAILQKIDQASRHATSFSSWP